MQTSRMILPFAIAAALALGCGGAGAEPATPDQPTQTAQGTLTKTTLAVTGLT